VTKAIKAIQVLLDPQAHRVKLGRRVFEAIRAMLVQLAQLARQDLLAHRGQRVTKVTRAIQVQLGQQVQQELLVQQGRRVFKD
jgi:hypothetical protein